jgi:hypothetical protein
MLRFVAVRLLLVQVVWVQIQVGVNLSELSELFAVKKVI